METSQIPTKNSKIYKRLKTLSDIRSNAIIDSYLVSALWVDPSEKTSNLTEFADNKLKSWVEEHV